MEIKMYGMKSKKRKKIKEKIYNTRDSLVVTDPTTGLVFTKDVCLISGFRKLTGWNLELEASDPSGQKYGHPF